MNDRQLEIVFWVSAVFLVILTIFTIGFFIYGFSVGVF